MKKVKEINVDLVQGESIELDSRLRFEDGRLYITHTPYINGVQSEFSKK